MARPKKSATPKLTLAGIAAAVLAFILNAFGLLPGESPPVAVPLLDRLRARLGEEAVTRVAPHPEHRPERASKAVPIGPSLPLVRPRDPGLQEQPDPPRPLWLFAAPRPLRLSPGDRPWVLCDGPERIESGWWDGTDVRRDYFVAEIPGGGRAWIFRDARHGFGEGDGEWFVHGLFA